MTVFSFWGELLSLLQHLNEICSYSVNRLQVRTYRSMDSVSWGDVASAGMYLYYTPAYLNNIFNELCSKFIEVNCCTLWTVNFYTYVTYTVSLLVFCCCWITLFVYYCDFKGKFTPQQCTKKEKGFSFVFWKVLHTVDNVVKMIPIHSDL